MNKTIKNCLIILALLLLVIANIGAVRAGGIYAVCGVINLIAEAAALVRYGIKLNKPEK